MLITWPTFAEAVIKDATRRVHALDFTGTGAREKYSAALYVRCVRALKAGKLLVSNSYCLEVAAISRCSVEAFLILSAFAKDPGKFEDYLRSTGARNKRLLKFMRSLEHDERADIAPDEWFDQIAPMVEEMAAGANEVQIAEYAKAAGYAGYHRMVYSKLSEDPHHLPASIAGQLRQCLIGQRMRVTWRPDESDPDRILDDLTSTAIMALEPLGHVFGFDASSDRAWRDLCNMRCRLRAASPE